MIRLALGTAQLGLNYGIANQTGQVSGQGAREMLALATHAGVDTLDTAAAYGESEARLGALGVESFRVVTKLPSMPAHVEDVAAWVQSEVQDSLSRLRVPHLHALMLHRPLELLGPRGDRLYQALNRLKQTQVIDKIGVSVYGPEQLEALIPRFPIEIVQAPLNLVDRRLHRSGWLRRLHDLGIEVHTRSAFLQGLLLMPAGMLPERFVRWVALWANWHGWLQEHKVSPIRACLAYPLSHPEIDRVVVGADSPDQLWQIFDAAADGWSAGFPDLACEDPDLIDPSRWS